MPDGKKAASGETIFSLLGADTILTKRGETAYGSSLKLSFVLTLEWYTLTVFLQVFRNRALKFIPNVVAGPWVMKKMVNEKPCLIAQKLPVSHYGSVDDGYLEICMNVTSGGKVVNSICSSCASKAGSLTIDLAFLLQGSNEKELPEQLLTVMRQHHVLLTKGISG